MSYSANSDLMKISICILLFSCVTNVVMAAETDSLFKSDAVIKMELRSDFSAIQNDRADNPKLHDGELTYYTLSGESKKFSVTVRARGIFRRDPEHCKFPPLAVTFKKNEVKNTLFGNQGKLKLVTPCQNDEDVIKEYLIYKMYNQVTDLSMKVRLVKILYFDTGRGKELFEKYSFFIEEKEQVAQRNNALVKDKFITPFDLNRENAKRMSVFQYIIGNRDWYFTTRHNLVLMQPGDTTLAPFAVPYDFDFSGFVNADYTKPKGVPDELLSKRRVYKGICYSTDEFNDVFKFYQVLRPEFESIINNMELIPKNSRKQLLEYLKYFYKVIESDKLIKQEFMEVCETKKTYNIIDK
jgi:hypothetical protein